MALGATGTDAMGMRARFPFARFPFARFRLLASVCSFPFPFARFRLLASRLLASVCSFPVCSFPVCSFPVCSVWRLRDLADVMRRPGLAVGSLFQLRSVLADVMLVEVRLGCSVAQLLGALGCSVAALGALGCSARYALDLCWSGKCCCAEVPKSSSAAATGLAANA